MSQIWLNVIGWLAFRLQAIIYDHDTYCDSGMTASCILKEVQKTTC